MTKYASLTGHSILVLVESINFCWRETTNKYRFCLYIDRFLLVKKEGYTKKYVVLLIQVKSAKIAYHPMDFSECMIILSTSSIAAV